MDKHVMTRRAFIKVELTLLPKEEGGREYPLFLDNEEAFYRPHIVIGDLNQRRPILKQNSKYIDEEYLGVQFRPCKKVIHPGDTEILILDLMYYPQLNYEQVRHGATFTLREGRFIRGFGKVLNINFEQ